MVDKSESKIGAGVTMLFCFTDLGVVWVNANGEIVDIALAKPWRPSYTPKAPAQYVVETDPTQLEHISVGDHLRFKQIDPGS